MTKILEPRADRPLRLAYVTDQFLPGDTTDTIQIVSMASGFGWHGVDTTIVMPLKSELPTAPRIARHYGVEPDFEVLPLAGPYPAPFGFRGLEKVAFAHASARRIHTTRIFDVTYTRNLPVVMAMLAETRQPVFYETYRPWPELDRTKALLFKMLARESRLAGVIVNSQLLVDGYLRAGFGPERVLVAQHGVDPRRFAAPMDRDDARAKLGLPKKGTLAVYVGQIGPGKGPELVLDAAARLADVSFAMVGSMGVGPIERRAATLGNVKLVPWRPPSEVSTWLMAADILIVPPTASPLEPMSSMLPQKTYQYLASGRAIIGPDTPALREVLTDGYDAKLVPPDSLEGFLRELTALSRDPGLRAALGNRARASALSRTWEDRAGRVLDFMVLRGIETAAQHRQAQRGPRPV